MSVTRFPRLLLRTFTWIAIVVLALVALFVGYVQYVVATHDTVNLPPHHGKVQEELYVGGGASQPLLVGLGGSEGGNAWSSDFWKAQRDEFIDDGYAFLAIGYFGREGIPEKLDRISLEGVHDAIARAAAHTQVDARCIVLIGGSKGAELALSLAARYPDIGGVVAIVPSQAVFPGITDAMTTSSFTWRGEQLPFVPVPWSTTWPLLGGDLLRVSEIMLEDAAAVERAAIPVEAINGPILFVSATRDEFWPSRAMSDAMMRRLDERQFPFVHEHVAIEGGHTEPVKHFDRIEAFLDAQFRRGGVDGCERRSREEKGSG
jgi:uncharacterized protein